MAFSPNTVNVRTRRHLTMSDRWFWEVSKLGLVAGLAVAGSGNAIAQIVPDSTLGNENSVVVPINTQLEHIQGGALRGSNLFHSFEQFGIQNGHSAYFVNPAIVENIFSRVTGANVSEIFGTLGVLGEANLYLINPNGIIFGENASLDIKGSFVATTASRLVFGDGSEYSAVNPEIPGMIINNVPIHISLQFEGEPATIVNLGNLSTGESLTLAGGNLDLEGELEAEEDLTLTAEDTVKIRDRESDRFVAAAGNNLLIQGNEEVDIFALNHAESGLFSGENMVLRSNNAVIGDAHYYSGGSFRIEELDGDLGKLESPNDPVIRSLGDVSFDTYQGTSLHIIAGGSVIIENGVLITGSERGVEGIDYIQENVTLSNGNIVPINGREEPTLDIRAGVDPNEINMSGVTGKTLFVDFFNQSVSQIPDTSDTIPDNANITVGTIYFGDTSLNLLTESGRVLLTNNYKPNTSLNGNIELSAKNFLALPFNGIALRAVTTTGGGVVNIDSRGDITVDGIISVNGGTSTPFVIQGNGGNVMLLANHNILITEAGHISSSGLSSGRILLDSNAQIIIEGDSNNSFGGLDGIEAVSIGQSQDRGQDVIVNTQSIILRKGANIVVGTPFFSGIDEGADGGNIIINASKSVQLLNGGSLTVSKSGNGEVGNITVNTQQLVIQNKNSNSELLSSIIVRTGPGSTGKGGQILINATDSIEMIGNQNTPFNPSIGEVNKIISNPSNLTSIPFVFASISTTTESSIVDSGNITLNTGRLVVRDGAGISTATVNTLPNGGALKINAESIEMQNLSGLVTTTLGEGKAGDLMIRAQEISLQDGAVISVDTLGSGGAGNLDIKTNQLNIQNGSRVGSSSFDRGNGDGGNTIINAKQIEIVGMSADRSVSSGLYADTQNSGNAGNITVSTEQLTIREGGQITTATSSSGDAGDITLNIANNVRLIGNNTGLFAQTQGEGDAGDILVNTPELNLLQGATIRASTSDRGNSGDITVNAPTSIFLGGNSQLSVETSNAGKAGNITLTTPNLTVEELARITATATATATTQQQGGSITVNASQMNLAGTVGIFAETQGQVPAGTLTLQPDNNQNNLDINFQQGAQISASTSGSGTGGSLFVFAPDTIDISGDGTLAVETHSTGNAGNIEMRAANLNLSNGAKISASTLGEGQGGNIDLAIARHIQLSDRSTGILASTAADSRGNGGNINIQTAYLNAADGVEIGVNSQGMGTGGDIDIQGDRIDLNNSQITAETRSTQGGNIDLTVRDLFLMRHGSKISTTAGTAQAGGDGGNITITAENGFLVGPPGEDNDITANAFEGNGGNINITAQEIFGLKFRDQLTPRSDITASSEFGLDGTVQLNTLGIDPNNGLTNLPEDQNDPEVRQGCSQEGANSSSLTVQGIGGAPDNPDDMLTPEIDDEFISLDELETDGTIAENTIALPNEKRSLLAFSCQ